MNGYIKTLFLFFFNNLILKLVHSNDLIKNKLEIKELHIGGVFPMEAGTGGWPGGQACLPAVKMALADINDNPDVLPNYKLRLHYHNSKCQPGLASKQLFELLCKVPTKLMLLSGCSPVTTIFAESAPVWNLIVISYGASSPALSNRARFPTLFRTHPSANMQNPTRVKLFQTFNWKKITILQSVEEVFISTAKDLEEEARSKGIKVDRQTFFGDPTDAIKTLVRQDARIIVGLFYVTEARRVLCQAYQHGLYGRKYVWFFIGWYADTWYIPTANENINCTAEQMTKAAEYHFTTESVMLSKDNIPTISGITGYQFQQKLNLEIKTDPANTGGYPEAPLAYDSVWALALALNCTQNALPTGVKLEDFTYNNAIIANQLFQCVKNTRFKGVSGPVMFSDSGDRIAKTQIEQLRNGKYSVLGFYDTTNQTLIWFNNESFAGDRGPPPDSTIIRQKFVTLNIKHFSVVIIFIAIGFLVIVSILIFNCKFSSQKIIVCSQPHINNLLIIGCGMCLCGLLLLGLPTEDYVPLSQKVFSFLCHTRISLLIFGFTCSYGALFSKVWIVHQRCATLNQKIITSNKEEEYFSPWENVRVLFAVIIKKQIVTNTTLKKTSSSTYENANFDLSQKNLLNQPVPIKSFVKIIGLFLAVDFFISFIWIVIDPLKKQRKTFILQEPTYGYDEDVKFLPILELCESSANQLWIALVLGYKGLLLILGLFLAFEARHIKMRHVNDLKFVLLAICNVSVLCLICAPIVVFFLKTQIEAFFGFVSATILFCTYISLGLIFIPKIIYLYKTPFVKNNSSVLHSEKLCHLSQTYIATAKKQKLISKKTNKLSSEKPISLSEKKANRLRYEKLLKENTELKKQIEFQTKKIAACNHLLKKTLQSDFNKELKT